MAFVQQLFKPPPTSSSEVGSSSASQQQQRQQPSLYPPTSALLPPQELLLQQQKPPQKQQLSPFGPSSQPNNTNDEEKEEQQAPENSSNNNQEWMTALPLFGQDKRYRPSETWAAVSPKLPNMGDVFPQEYRRKQLQNHQANKLMMNSNNNRSQSNGYFSQFDDDEGFYQNNNNNNPSNTRSPSRSRTVDSMAMMNENVSDNNNDENTNDNDELLSNNSIDYFSKSFTSNNNNNNVHVDPRSSSIVTATIASGVRSFTGAHDYESSPFAPTRNKTTATKQRLRKSSPSAAGRGDGKRFLASRGTVNDSIASSSAIDQQEKVLNNNNDNNTANTPTTSDQDLIEDLLTDGNQDDYLQEDNSWLKHKMLSYGSTSNPQSQRLFERLAPEKLNREREQMRAEALAREAAQYQQQTKLRSANNLLPPTPFSNKVAVLKGSFPNWIRRCDPALDLEARVDGTNKLTNPRKKKNNNRFQQLDGGSDFEASGKDGDGDDDDDDDSSDDEAIFDEFLLREKDQAKREKPRTEKRGDFYRLNLQSAEANTSVLKIHETAPSQEKDPNQTALEFLAVSRPEFAPALRRLAPWQLQLIDWSSLFRGGTHQDVSVTAKRFPHGAPWDASPFSEAPVASGGLGFVGNLQKREKETSFFSKLHGSNDGRVSDDNMQGWMKKCPIRFNVRDDMRKGDDDDENNNSQNADRQ